MTEDLCLAWFVVFFLEPVQFKRKNGAIERQDQRRTLFLRVISGIERLHSIESFPSPLCT